MYSIYKWSNLKPNSPRGQTRNQWLYKYGAFASYRGLWFPCTVVANNMFGEPAVISPINDVGYSTLYKDLNLIPATQLAVADLDVLYTVFNNGLSISTYVFDAVKLSEITKVNLKGAVQRSLHTDLIVAPKKIMAQVKESINKLWKGERHVINGDGMTANEIVKIDLPNTSDMLEKLWNSHDWAKQEICEILGISYNPSQGKKERLLVDEIQGDRDLTIMNRLRVVERLEEDAESFGETVQHISDYVKETHEGGYRDGENIIQRTSEPE